MDITDQQFKIWTRTVDSQGNPKEASLGTMVDENNVTKIKMTGDEIILQGDITANGNVHINQDGTIVAKNGIFEGYLRSSVLRDVWNLNHEYLVKDNLNIMTAGAYDCNVYLPVDSKYVGARLVIIAGVDADNTGQINGTLKYTTVSFNTSEILSDDEATAAEKTWAVQNANLWIIGGLMFYDGSHRYCATKVRVEGGGSIEFLGVDSNVHVGGDPDAPCYTQWVILNTSGKIQYGRAGFNCIDNDSTTTTPAP